MDRNPNRYAPLREAQQRIFEEQEANQNGKEAQAGGTTPVRPNFQPSSALTLDGLGSGSVFAIPQEGEEIFIDCEEKPVEHSLSEPSECLNVNAYYSTRERSGMSSNDSPITTMFDLLEETGKSALHVVSELGNEVGDVVGAIASPSQEAQLEQIPAQEAGRRSDTSDLDAWLEQEQQREQGREM